MNIQKFKFVSDFYQAIRENFKDYIINENIGEKELIKDWIGNNKQGAYATVSRGYFYGQPIALKEIRLSLQELQEIINKQHEIELNAIIAELKIMSKVKNPNIPKFYGILLNEERYQLNIVLQYIDGASLKTLIENKAHLNWSSYQKLWLVYKISKVLEYIRNLGVIHRDVKPENIMIEINSNLEPYLIDFGLSKLMNADHEYTVSLMKCTPQYSAPESMFDLEKYASQIDSSEESLTVKVDNFTQLTRISYKVDVWSLGCVIYELFTNRLPFQYLKGDGKSLQVNNLLSYHNQGKNIFSQEDKKNNPTIMNLVENCTKQNVKERWEIEKASEEIAKLIAKDRENLKESLECSEYDGQGLKISSKEIGSEGENEKIVYDGIGTLSYTKLEDDKFTYIGGFQYGNKYGFGYETNEERTITYQGLWNNNQKHGEGFYSNKKGDECVYYIGDFRYNNKQGYGMHILEDQVSYGLFYNDMLIEGIKFEKFLDVIYKGNFEKDMFVFGEVYYRKTGDVYYGEYKDDKRNGYGYLKSHNSGKIEQCGLWKDNQLKIKVHEFSLNN